LSFGAIDLGRYSSAF